jgi:hypothetical protein
MGSPEQSFLYYLEKMNREMEILSLLKRLEESKQYRDWAESNPGFYLVHLLYMSKHPPQIGFYNEESDRIVTFEVGDQIVASPTTEAFKEQRVIEEIDIESVKFDREDALGKANSLKDERYPKEVLDSDILILQKVKGQTMYNITYFTKAFRTLNVKINAESGEIISHDLANLVGF